MKLTYLIWMLPAATMAVAMDMDTDMGMDMDMATDMTDSSPSSSVSLTSDSESYLSSSGALVPVPYEPKHLHGLPILQRPGLTPAEKLYWSNYNTTTYFTTDLGDRTAFRYHVVTLGIVAVFLYPICLALNSIGSQWYLPVLTMNLCLTLSSLLALSIFGSTFPEDWYPKNAYRRVSWV